MSTDGRTDRQIDRWVNIESYDYSISMFVGNRFHVETDRLFWASPNKHPADPADMSKENLVMKSFWLHRR